MNDQTSNPSGPEPEPRPVFEAIVAGDQERARSEAERALASGIPAGRLLQESMIPAMGEVGRLFEENLYFLPEMLIAARAMKAAMAVVEPTLQAGEVRSAGSVVIGTVAGDMHDIGKNLVATMLSGHGFQIHDLGADVAPERFVEAAREHQADVVAMSALLSTTMTQMDATIEALTAAGLREGVKVLVGGAPLTEARALEMGADGYAPDASRAVARAAELLVPH